MKKQMTMTVLLLTAVITATVDARDFSFTQRTDPMSDTDRSYIAKTSMSGKESLMWACGESGLTVLFAFNETMIGPFGVEHRFPPFAADVCRPTSRCR